MMKKSKKPENFRKNFRICEDCFHGFSGFPVNRKIRAVTGEKIQQVTGPFIPEFF